MTNNVEYRLVVKVTYYVCFKGIMPSDDLFSSFKFDTNYSHIFQQNKVEFQVENILYNMSYELRLKKTRTSSTIAANCLCKTK